MSSAGTGRGCRGSSASVAPAEPLTPQRFCAVCSTPGNDIDLVVSRAARLTLLDETGVAWHDDADSLHAWLTSRLDADLPPLHTPA